MKGRLRDGDVDAEMVLVPVKGAARESNPSDVFEVIEVILDVLHSGRLDIQKVGRWTANEVKEREKGKGIAEKGFVFGDALIERVKITVPRLVTSFRGDIGKRGSLSAVIRVEGIP